MAIEAAEREQTTDTSTDEEIETEAPEVDTEANEEGDPPETKPEDDEDAEVPEPPKKNPPKLTVSLDDEEESPPTDEKAALRWRELRRKEKELDELRARLTVPAPQEAAPVLPPMPTAADPDIDHDGVKLAARMREWVKQEAKVEAHKAKAKSEQEATAQEWQKVLGHFAERRKAVVERTGPERFDTAERFVVTAFDEVKRSLILEVADDPATLVLALSQNPEEAKALAAIKSLPKFTKALVDMERSMTVTPTKKPKAPPEETTRGSGSSAPGNKVRDALEVEARRSGDRSKVAEHDRKQREKSRK